MSVASKPRPMMGMPVTSDPKPTDAFQWTQEPWGRALRCTSLPAPHLFTSRDVELREDEGEWAAVAPPLRLGRDGLMLTTQAPGINAAVARRGPQWPAPPPQADIIITDD